MVAHPSNEVRSCIVTLLNIVIPTSKTPELVAKILPALITLSHDPDAGVRNNCIDPLANIAVNSPNDDTLDKLTGAFDKMLEDDTYKTRLGAVHALAHIIPQLTLKLKFRDTYILPKLVEQARRNSVNVSNPEQKRDMSNALFEAFRTLVSSASLNKEAIEDYVLPGLKLLLIDGGVPMDTTFKTMVQSMISDMDSTNNNATSTTSSSSEKENSSTSNDKGSIKRNILNKLDTTTLTSLRADFDKALPKWTWKNR